MPCEIGEQRRKDTPVIVENTKIAIDEEVHDETDDSCSDHSGAEDDYKIDKLFYRICFFCFMLGVNFYRQRCYKMRTLSMIMVVCICCINLYYIGYVAALTLTKPFEPERVAISISMCTWVLQATLSTFFLAWWQYTSQPCKLIKLLHEAHKGVGIHHYRGSLKCIIGLFYIVLSVTVCYYIGMMIANFFEIDVGYMDRDIPKIFGGRRLFLIVQLANLYCILCWGVALFIFSLLVHSAHYEFKYYNDQVRSLVPHDKRRAVLKPICLCDLSIGCTCAILPQQIKCDLEYKSDEALCCYLQKLMKIHNRLTECVKRLDLMFHRYAFVMIATIIPTTIFSLFMVFRRPKDSFGLELLLSCPLVFFCVFSFFALVNAPSQLHNTIYNTKSDLCANTHIWFPYRPNVYHSALAFVCHLDQTNLGVSIWGFAVVSKPLVLTTLSVMVTCLALFLQVGDCNSGFKAVDPTMLTTF